MRESENPRTASTGRRWLGCLLTSIAVLCLPAAASDDLCGSTIVTDFTLTGDLACTGDGLVVGADGITIHLDGYALTGSGTGAGILVSGRTDVTIRDGKISNFFSGVLITESTDVTVRDLEIWQNNDGVDCQAGCAGSTVKDNDFRDNLVRGIMLRSSSSDITVKDNTFSGNRVGVLLFGCLDCTVKDNSMTASGLAGVRINVLATGNMVKGNLISSSPAGIEFLVVQLRSAAGNAVVDNALEANACGLKGPLAGNSVRGNVFDGNVSNICP